MGSFGNHYAEPSVELFRIVSKKSIEVLYEGYRLKMISLGVLSSPGERTWGLKPSTSLRCFSLMMFCQLGFFSLVVFSH
jgi:hypothetical protein